MKCAVPRPREEPEELGSQRDVLDSAVLTLMAGKRVLEKRARGAGAKIAQGKRWMSGTVGGDPRKPICHV